MCNLYTLRVSHPEIVAFYGADPDFRREIALQKDYVSPGRPAMIARDLDGTRVVDEMRWGFPHWQASGKDIVNVRNTASPFWRTALNNPARRCLVPFDRFQEWSVEADPLTGKKRPHFFSIPSRRIGTFAGVWRPTDTGPRFAFLTTGYGDDPGAAVAHVVGAIHPKAIPVILDGPPEFDRWLTAPIEDALALVAAYPSQLLAVE